MADTQNYYKSVFSGTQIDGALGRIINGELDNKVDAAAESATAAAEAAAEAAESASAAALSATAAEAAKTGAEASRQAIENMGVASETLPPGSQATVEKTVGQSGSVTLAFGIPQGIQGPAATIEVGTVTTGAPGTNASVTNTGTTGAAVFDFTIPRGYDGEGTGDMQASVYDPAGKASQVATAAELMEKADKKVPASAGNLAALDEAGNLSDSGLSPGGIQGKITATGLLKGDGTGGVTAAASGTDYAPAGHTHAQADVTGLADALSGKAAASHTHGAGDIASGTLSVERGGTGALALTSGAALIGAGTGAVSTRSILNNTSASSAIPANTNLITANTLRYALNRTTGPTSADTSYSTYMMRSIAAGTSDLTAGSSSLTSGAIYLVYE